MTINTDNLAEGLRQAQAIAFDSRDDRHSLVGSEVRELVMLAERFAARLAEVEGGRDDAQALLADAAEQSDDAVCRDWAEWRQRVAPHVLAHNERAAAKRQP